MLHAPLVHRPRLRRVLEPHLAHIAPLVPLRHPELQWGRSGRGGSGGVGGGASGGGGNTGRRHSTSPNAPQPSRQRASVMLAQAGEPQPQGRAGAVMLRAEERAGASCCVLTVCNTSRTSCRANGSERRRLLANERGHSRPCCARAWPSAAPIAQSRARNCNRALPCSLGAWYAAARFAIPSPSSCTGPPGDSRTCLIAAWHCGEPPPADWARAGPAEWRRPTRPCRPRLLSKGRTHPAMPHRPWRRPQLRHCRVHRPWMRSRCRPVRRRRCRLPCPASWAGCRARSHPCSLLQQCSHASTPALVCSPEARGRAV